VRELRKAVAVAVGESAAALESQLDPQREVIASACPFVPIERSCVDEVPGPRRGNEAEVDVPRLRVFELVTVRRVPLLPVLGLVERVIRADQSGGLERSHHRLMSSADWLVSM